MSTPSGGTGGFDTPEQGALDSWSASPGARASITSAEIIGDRAEVVVELGDHPDQVEYAYFIRREGRWHRTVSGSGPSERWWDDTFLHW
jgi:hypothetical protein